MTDDTDTILEKANALAQERFRAMLDAKSYGDPDAPETRGYVLAERIVDEALKDAQWERAKAALDAKIAADEDFAGDHHIYPAGVGR